MHPAPILFLNCFVDLRNLALGKFRACFGIRDNCTAVIPAAHKWSVEHYIVPIIRAFRILKPDLCLSIHYTSTAFQQIFTVLP